MANKNPDTNAKYFLSESGSIYEDKGDGYVDIDSKYKKWKINLSELNPLSLPELHYYKKYNKDERISLFKRKIFHQLQNVKVDKYYKIRVLNENVEVKIIGKGCNNNKEFCIKYMTKDKAEFTKLASSITDIVEIGGIGSNIANRDNTRTDDIIHEKSIVDGFYIVTDKLSACNSGSIIRVQDGVVIDRDINKSLNMSDIERDKLDKIEKNESIYLLKYQINERIEKHKNKIFNKIKELNIGDECYYKNDLNNIYIVKQINIDNKGVKLVLQLKDSSRNNREIDADAFDIELIKNSEFYILTNTKYPHQIGTIFRVENEIVKTFPEDVVNHYPRIQDMKLQKINIFEANFLKMFPSNKRMKKLSKEKFKKIKILSIGDKCFVNGKEFIVDKKYFLSNQLKFDLSSQKYHSEVLACVDASQISEKKKPKNVLENIQSSMNRQNSTGSGKSNDNIGGKSKPAFDNYEIKLGSVKLKVIKPLSFCEIVKAESDISERYIVLHIDSKQIFAKLLWKGMISQQICIGCEMLSDVNNGTDGTFNDLNLFSCNSKNGVLIPLKDNVKTCAKENCAIHLELNAKEIIKENDICCLQAVESFKSSNIKIGDNIIYNKANPFSGICKWIGLINGKECVAVVSEDNNSDCVCKSNELTQCINISSSDKNKVVMFQISNIPPIVNCKPINLDVINPYLIGNINHEGSRMFDKFIIIKNNNKSEVVKLLWKGTSDGKTYFGCKIHCDWPHGTNGKFKGKQLFECKDKRGVLIEIGDQLDTCESKDCTKHREFNADQIIKENDICCLKSCEKLSSEEISINSNLVWTKDTKLKGRCEWIGYINDEECVGISCENYSKYPSISSNSQLLERLNISKKILFVSLTDIIVEKLYFVEDRIVDLEKIFSIESDARNFEPGKRIGTAVKVNWKHEFKISVGNPVRINWKHEGESLIGEVKWTGLINNEKCVGLDMVMKHNRGMNGIIDKDNKFVCKPGHGLITSLGDVEIYDYSNILKTFQNGLVDPNQYIKFEENLSRFWKNFEKNENVFVKLLDRDDCLKGTIRLHGEMNKEQVAVIELEENHENGTNGKFWRNQLFTCQQNRAVATRYDNIHRYIPLKYHNNIFVENKNSLEAFNITKENDKYKVGEVIKTNMNPIIYGEVSFFTSYYNQDLVGIIVHMDSIDLLGKISGNLFFQNQYFDACCPGIIVKIESIEKCKEELKFNKVSGIIDIKSVVCKIFNHSNNLNKGDVVKLNTNGNDIFYSIIDLWKLNGEQCVEVFESILSNGDKFYFHEIDICKIDKSDWELKYFKQIIIDPSTIITLETCTSSDLEIGNKIKFNLNETNELFEGVIKFIGKANNILSIAVQLVDDKTTSKNNKLCKYSINQNKTFHSIWTNSNLPIIFLPLNILKLQDNCEYANGIPIVDPRFVKKIEGMKVETDRKIIFLCEGKKYFSNIKWKGKVDKKYCLGCEIDYPCEFGTNGKFGDKILFTCPDKHGILIPTDSIDRCCEIVGHQDIDQYDSKIINADNICCIRTDPDIGKDVRIYLNDQIKRKDDTKYPICKWLGYINNIKCVGVDMNYHVNEGTNGTFCGITLFQCKNNYGALYRLSEFISKKSDLKHLSEIGLHIVDSFNIKSIENGKQIDKLMNYKRNDRTYVLNIKWRGCVDGELCIGCELNNDSAFGTDGTFAGEKIFNCVKGKGVLIPVNTIYPSCEDDKHNKIEKHSDGMFGLNKNFHSINPDCICCVESLKCVKNYPSIQIGSKIQYLKGKQFFDGVCEWLGLVNGKESIGARMKENNSGTNGQFNNFKLFNCEPKKGFLFLIEDIKHDFENEKLHFICDKIVDIDKIYFVSLLDNPHENDRLIKSPAITDVTFPDGKKQKLIGEIKWIGKINNEKCVGLDMEDKFGFGIDGKIYENHKFGCRKEHGMITLLNNIKLLRNIDESHFCRNGIINPDKYLVCKEKEEEIEFLNRRNVKLNDFVFVLLKDENGERKKKGTLRWCGRMNELSVCIVELNEEHELGTDGRFWRTQLIKCGNKRAIAVLSINIYQYEPYESMIIPVCDRIFGDIDVNSAVRYYYECDNELKDLFGTVRWSGKDENNQYLYGIELDDRLHKGTDGQFDRQRLFKCQNGHGILVPIGSVTKDSRFVDLEVAAEDIVKSEECKVKESSILTKLSEGLNKGIQGIANSSIFVSAIFALFVKSDVLDFMIDEIHNETETNEITKQFRIILAFKIIYPLRKFGFVSFHRTNEMRDVIVKYGRKFEEMTKQESDMENVSALLSKLCPDEQLLSIVSHNGSMTKCMFMQLFLTLKKKVKFMKSEEMLKISMVQNDIMFNELPSCLIIQVPRDARGINCYEFVIPNKTIEISQLCSNYFKRCFHCKDAAVYQCKECIEGKLDISSSFLCENHKCDHNSIMRINIHNKSTSKVYLELKSIICIEKCHFVSYVKQSDVRNKNIDNRWYLFDSMSSKSISNNYSIPKVAYSKEVTDFLNSNVVEMKDAVVNYDSAYLKSIVNDSYIFVYQNSTKTCY